MLDPPRTAGRPAQGIGGRGTRRSESGQASPKGGERNLSETVKIHPYVDGGLNIVA